MSDDNFLNTLTKNEHGEVHTIQMRTPPKDIYSFIGMAMDFINEIQPDNITQALLKQQILIEYEANKKLLTRNGSEWKSGI